MKRRTFVKSTLSAAALASVPVSRGFGFELPAITRTGAETTITHADTGAEYESEAAAQADVDNPGTSTTAEKIRRDVKVFAPSLADMLGETPE